MKYFTIKEFAKIHNVNTRTLHYYDDVGLFSPDHKDDKGYRYYTYMQSAEFEIILALRELSMSIEEIKAYTENRNAKNFEKLLCEKSLEIDEKIKQLKQIKRILENKKSNLDLIHKSDLNKIDTVSCKTEYLFLVQMNDENEWDTSSLEEIINSKFSNEVNRVFNSSYGSIIPVENLKQGNFEEYTHYFIKIECPKAKKGLFKKESGEYIRAYCVGDWDTLPKAYKRILQYAEDNKLKLTGYSFEQGLNEMTIMEMNEYVTEILIRCERE